MRIVTHSIIRLASVMILAILAFALPALPVLADHDAANTGVTAVPDYNLRLRAGPSTGYARIGLVPGGVRVAVHARNESASWLYVDYRGARGWIAGWYCTVYGDLYSLPVTGAAGDAPASPSAESPPADPPATITVATRVNLRIRSGPGTTYGQIGLLSPSDTAEVFGRYVGSTGTWLYIKVDDLLGWAAGWYIQLQGGLVGEIPLTSPGAPTGSVAPNPAESTGGPVQVDLSRYTATLSNIGPHLIEVYRYGQTLGNNSHAFAKVGDCETTIVLYLHSFDHGPAHYGLGEYGYLQEVIDQFSGSFDRTGQAMLDGLDTVQLMDPLWANPNICNPGEHMLACEYRLHKPSIALIMMRSFEVVNVGIGSPYYAALRAAVQYSLDHGVIPVLGTIAYWPNPYSPYEPMNEAIRAVANEFNVPLWDFFQTTETLPNRGMGSADIQFEWDYTHLSRPPDADYNSARLVGDNLNYAMVRRNLESLEVLHAILHHVILPASQ
nr:SH3 domain-containing protein [Anaerolineae bacterium]